MKVGDLVSKRQERFIEDDTILFGIVLKMDKLGIKVAWNQNYGTFWTLKKTVSIVK